MGGVQDGDVARGRGIERIDPAGHQRPVEEDEAGVLRGHVRAEQEQDERRGGPERGEEREPLAAAAPADAGRVGGPDQEVDEDADEGHRGRQVGRDALAGVAEPDGLPPEVGLEARRARRRRPTATGSRAGRDGRGRRRRPSRG